MSGQLVSPVLVGRGAERAQLIAALDEIADGATRFVLVGGEAGVGKSRLVAEVVGAAQQRGVRVLAGQCVELGSGAQPFAPLADALRGLARSTTPEEFARVLGPARQALLRLLPGAGAGAEDDAASPVSGSSLLELVLGLLERLAEAGPVVLVIEDLHWADQSTLDLVAYLVRAMRDVPVLLVGTYRADEMTRRHPLHALLLGWRRSRASSTSPSPGSTRPRSASSSRPSSAVRRSRRCGRRCSSAPRATRSSPRRSSASSRPVGGRRPSPSRCATCCSPASTASVRTRNGSSRSPPWAGAGCPSRCCLPSPGWTRTPRSAGCARRSRHTCSSSTRPAAATPSGTRSPATPSTTTCCPGSGPGCTPPTGRR